MIENGSQHYFNFQWRGTRGGVYASRHGFQPHTDGWVKKWVLESRYFWDVFSPDVIGYTREGCTFCGNESGDIELRRLEGTLVNVCGDCLEALRFVSFIEDGKKRLMFSEDFQAYLDNLYGVDEWLNPITKSQKIDIPSSQFRGV